MWWLLTALVLVVVAVLVRELLGLRACNVQRVVAGRHVDLAADLPRPDAAVAYELSAAAANGGIATHPSPHRSFPAGDATWTRQAHHDGAVAGGLAAATGLVDWFWVDPELLEAVEHWTHTSVDNGLDLWRTVHDRDYGFLSAGFERALRGHVGEQEVEAQLATWAGDRVLMPNPSNNPGFDLQLDGHAANVKVGQHVSAIREHLAANPDIPVIVNADMHGLPEDALHLDLTQPFDPNLLAEHSVIVADGLLMSDLQDSMADAFGPSLASFGAEDLADGAGDLAVPGLGSVLRVVRSGIRENKLRAVHGDDARAWRNIGTDAALVGGGATGGGLLGVGLGAAIDVATMGATAGLGTTVIGPAIGAVFGGWAGGKKATEVRMRPLTDARAATTQAVQDYGQAVTTATDQATATWTTIVLPGAEDRAQQSATQLKATASRIAARARRDLEQTAHLETAQRIQLLTQATAAVDDTARRLPTHWLVRHRIRAWRSAAARARTGPAGSALDVVAAAPGGRELVRSHLAQATRRRATILASAGVTAARLQRQAEQDRLALLLQLIDQRDRLQDGVRQAVQPHLAAIEAGTADVRRELVATGAKPQQWVDEHFPAQSNPTTSSVPGYEPSPPGQR